jgi:hypothetical protein
VSELRARPVLSSAKGAVYLIPDRASRPATSKDHRSFVDRLHAAVLRIDSATPAGRDRAVDMLRALAIAGVVVGHWLVSAVVLRTSGHLVDDSPLRLMPGLTPMSWVLQTLALFFLVGGRVGSASHASAEARGIGYRGWLAGRLRRLLRPTIPLAITWALVLLGLVATGVAPETTHTLLWFAFSPLWFFGVYVALTAATPLVRRAPRTTAVVALLVVAATDSTLVIPGGGAIGVIRWLNVPAGWLVPYCIGVLWASGRLTRRHQLSMLVGGGLAATALILWCGYPASMVGVPGARLSNLNPPTLPAVCFGLAQCGAALLLCGPLRRVLGQPVAGVPRVPPAEVLRATPRQFLWAAVALLNLSAVTVFLWHQTAMVITTVVALGAGHPVFALHTSPQTPLWVVARLGWVPVFAVVLWVLWAVFHRWEREGDDVSGTKRSEGSSAQHLVEERVGRIPGERVAAPGYVLVRADEDS